MQPSCPARASIVTRFAFVIVPYLLQNALSAMAKAHQPSVELEQTTYYYLAEAHAVYEKAKYVQSHLREAIAVLEPRRSTDLAGEDGHPRTPMEL